MNFIEEEDLLYYYPPQTFDILKDSEFLSLQRYLTTHFEFSSLIVGEKNEKLGNRKFFSQQILASRFLYIWDKLLAFHDF